MVLLIACVSERRAVLVLLLPLAIPWAAFFGHGALVADDPLRDDVVKEMGAGYAVHEAVAALLLVGAVVGGLMVERKRNRGAAA